MTFARVAILTWKEWLQILRDPSSLIIAFVVPVILLVLFGYGVSLDLERIKVAVVVQEQTPQTQEIASAFANARYFTVLPMADQRKAETLLAQGAIAALVVIDAQQARRAAAETPAKVQALIDGVDASTGPIVQSYIESAVSSRFAQLVDENDLAPPPNVAVQSRIWFNSALTSRYFIVPGLIAIIMTVIGALLTALVVAREWERGTLEALMVTPLTAADFLASKLLPYFLLGMGGMALSVAIGIVVFAVPFRGSFAALTLASAAFMLSALGLGLVISSATKNQFVASQLGLIAGYLPAFMLSGFLFDIASMPGWIQAVTYLVPARYFVTILQTEFLVGHVPDLYWPAMAPMTAMGVALLALCVRLTRKSLD